MRRARQGALRVAGLALALAACNDTASPVGAPGMSQVEGKNVAGACSPARFPSNEPALLGCCQDGQRNWVTRDGQQGALRIYDAPPCTEADGVGTDCGVGSDPFKPCAYGPCGARIEWRVIAEAIHIFVPGSKPTKCGWQVAGVAQCLEGCDWPAGATRWNPEPYADQVTYAGLTGTCPYRRCLKGGTPSQ